MTKYDWMCFRLLMVVATAGEKSDVRPRPDASLRAARRLLQIGAQGQYRCFLTAAWLGKSLDR